MEVEKLTDTDSSCQNGEKLTQTEKKSESARGKEKTIDNAKVCAIARIDMELERLQTTLKDAVVNGPVYGNVIKMLCEDIEHLKRIKRALENE